jgi:hypothetical protein
VNFPLNAVRDFVSAVRNDGKPVVRLTCADYGTEWVVAADVYAVDGVSVQPKSAGPYVFATAQEARRFVESSLAELALLGCEVA